jgi:hypothetical protein
MKSIITAFFLFASTLLWGADMTGGVFRVDQDIECLLVTQNGSTTTNKLEAGKTWLLSW